MCPKKITLRLALIAAVGLLSLPSTGATEYTVSTLDELTNTLDLVSRSSGETVVTIDAGVYDLSDMVKMHSSAMLSVSNGAWGRKITIQGDPAADRGDIVLDAGQAGRVLWMYGFAGSTTTLKHLTVRNGLSTTGKNGGVQTTNWGVFRFEDCVFGHNRALNGSSAAGGTGERYFTDCLFLGNTIGSDYGNGGVIDDPKSVSGCVFRGNGAYGDQMKGVCVKASCVITNCVFDSNCNTGRWGEASAVYLSGSGSCVDCTFTNNTWGSSTTKGGALVLAEGASAVRCRFIGNAGSLAAGGAIAYVAGDASPGKIDACDFTGNKTAGTAYGGAVANFPGLITNCTFAGNSAYYGGAVFSCTNIVDCVFAGNNAIGITRLENGGAGYKSVFYGCTVTNNVGKDMSGAFSDCRVYRSKVGMNRVVNSPGERTVESDDTYFEDCELFGLRTFGIGYNKCGFNRCVIRDNVLAGGYGYLFNGVTAVTNCLILGNGVYRMFNSFPYGADNAIVNCSFVSNRYDILATHASPTSTLRVVNCLFHGNGTRTWAHDDDIGQYFATTVFSNNYISTAQTYPGDGNIDARAASAPKPGLMLARDPVHPYAPNRRSVLNGAAILEPWMASAVDLAGNPRLTEGKAAIGAYETMDPVPGSLLLVR